MGGKRQQQPQQWKDSREQYWRGAWVISPRSQRAQQPRYDQVQLDGPNHKGGWDHPWSTGAEDSLRAPTLAQAVQKELTAARKADSRLRRLTSEKEMRAKQWEKFKAEQKRNFVLQKQQFAEDIERLDAELQQASESGRAAADRMKSIVLQGASHGAALAVTPTAEDQEWEAMMSAEEMVVEPAPFLQEALHAAQFAGHPLPVSGTPAGPVHPPAGRLPAFGTGGPPPAVGHVGHATSTAATGSMQETQSHMVQAVSPASTTAEPLLTDPYTGMSPVRMAAGPEQMLAGDRRTSPIHPGQRAPGAPRVPTAEAPPRAGIKPATSAPNQIAHAAQAGNTLADKLEAKRSVLEPFGKARPPPPPGLAPAGPSEAEIAIAEARAMALHPQGTSAPPGTHPALASASIVDDDEGEGEDLI